jgi:hypothetical protein
MGQISWKPDWNVATVALGPVFESSMNNLVERATAHLHGLLISLQLVTEGSYHLPGQEGCGW